MDARLETVLDIDFAAAFEVTVLVFPIGARFMAYYPTTWLSTYALHMARSRCFIFEPASVAFGI
jgi:hypothetical protein